MFVKSIEFPTYLEDPTNVENGNIDVFVELEDGSNHCVVVGTPQNIEYLINKEGMNCLKPGYPFIIVNKLTEDVIKEAIQIYAADDAHWLKLHSLAGDIDIKVLNELQVD